MFENLLINVLMPIARTLQNIMSGQINTHNLWPNYQQTPNSVHFLQPKKNNKPESIQTQFQVKGLFSSSKLDYYV